MNGEVWANDVKYTDRAEGEVTILNIWVKPKEWAVLIPLTPVMFYLFQPKIN